jgi:hypothetical protein
MGGRGYLLDVFYKCTRDKLVKVLRPVLVCRTLCECWGRICRDLGQRAERWYVRERRLALREFDSDDPHGPNVASMVVVSGAVVARNNLWSHPVRCANHCRSLALRSWG